MQVALSLVLVAGALLFTRSLGNLMTVNAGFKQQGMLIANVGFRRLNVPPERRLAFKDELLNRIKAIPGMKPPPKRILFRSAEAVGNTMWPDGADGSERKSVT